MCSDRASHGHFLGGETGSRWVAKEKQIVLSKGKRELGRWGLKRKVRQETGGCGSNSGRGDSDSNQGVGGRE